MADPNQGFSYYNEVKGWQGAIGSLLGFIALIIGALWNFHLNRRRDAHLRAEDAASVAAALYGEIVLLRKEAARLAAAVANIHMKDGWGIIKFDKFFLEAHTLSEPMLYKALGSKIGLLDADLVIAITEFHQNFQEARTWLPLLLEREDRPYSYGPLVVLRPARDAVVNVLPTLRKIEQMTGVQRKVEENLDLGNAEVVIDMEEEFLNTPSET